VQYFCDARRLARAHSEAPFGDEFSEAKADVYDAQLSQWIEKPVLSAVLRFGREVDAVFPRPRGADQKASFARCGTGQCHSRPLRTVPSKYPRLSISS
jgi:hypothetical protein